MGCTIGTAGGTASGTLGGFVDLGQGDVGFITCAHVLHEKLPIIKEIMTASFSVVQPDFGKCGTNKICGQHIRAVCPFSRGPNATSVDEALVKVSSSRKPVNGLFAGLHVSPKQVCEARFNIEKPPSFSIGEIRDLRGSISSEHRFKPCFKVGAEFGLSKGSLHLNCTAVRLVSGTLKRQPGARGCQGKHNAYVWNPNRAMQFKIATSSIN
ncbi:uncharacterized protein LOC134271022 [Saccostrea cucullata]|uniref:uncharacterized protein LOC134271022 n=1 Tax=Saccostrea cuccullata TaxID=36930 RepID=UPI002ED53423